MKIMSDEQDNENEKKNPFKDLFKDEIAERERRHKEKEEQLAKEKSLLQKKQEAATGYKNLVLEVLEQLRQAKYPQRKLLTNRDFTWCIGYEYTSHTGGKWGIEITKVESLVDVCLDFNSEGIATQFICSRANRKSYAELSAEGLIKALQELYTPTQRMKVKNDYNEMVVKALTALQDLHKLDTRDFPMRSPISPEAEKADPFVELTEGMPNYIGNWELVEIYRNELGDYNSSVVTVRLKVTPTNQPIYFECSRENQILQAGLTYDELVTTLQKLYPLPPAPEPPKKKGWFW